GLEQQLDHPMGRQCGGGSRLGDHRHAGEEGAGELLGEPPGGEVEGVDVQGDSGPRNERVAAPERLALAELQAVAVDQVAALAEALTETAVEGEGAAAPVDVEAAVG